MKIKDHPNLMAVLDALLLLGLFLAVAKWGPLWFAITFGFLTLAVLILLLLRLK